MEATRILMEEHRVIERVVSSLDRAARRLDAGEPIEAGFFVDAADFIKGFADGCHHKKEESVLFPAMERAGVSRQGGPLAVMLAEHEEGRRLTRAMRAAAEELATGRPEWKTGVVQNALGYVALLRQHIAKENGVLFPMANRVIAPEVQGGLAEAFDRIEHEEIGVGMHEKYLAMAERLERQAGR
ncbi:MAG: hemerythrin domain-containing protein [Chloroflexi bacterium]|nr:hemerythrin domain-containing protein [Chloroflexota bacterium]